MYTRPYGKSEPPFRVPPHYGGNAFLHQAAPQEPPKEQPLGGILEPLQALAGKSFRAPGTPDFDELFLLGLIFLLSGSEQGKEIIPILALLLFV